MCDAKNTTETFSQPRSRCQNHYFLIDQFENPIKFVYQAQLEKLRTTAHALPDLPVTSSTASQEPKCSLLLTLPNYISMHAIAKSKVIDPQ